MIPKSGTGFRKRSCFSKKHDPEKWNTVFGRDHASAKKHDPEKACPGLDPGWNPVFGKDHAFIKCSHITTSLFGNSFLLIAPGGKCFANTSPQIRMASRKPSTGWRCFIFSIIAFTALSQTSGETLALMPASATIST